MSLLSDEEVMGLNDSNLTIMARQGIRLALDDMKVMESFPKQLQAIKFVIRELICIGYSFSATTSVFENTCHASTSFNGMYPLLTCQLTWQFPIVDGPSKLGQDIIIAVIGRWASHCTIPSYIDWLRVMSGALSSYPIGQPRTVDQLNYLRTNC